MSIHPKLNDRGPSAFSAVKGEGYENGSARGPAKATTVNDLLAGHREIHKVVKRRS